MLAEVFLRILVDLIIESGLAENVLGRKTIWQSLSSNNQFTRGTAFVLWNVYCWPLIFLCKILSMALVLLINSKAEIFQILDKSGDEVKWEVFCFVAVFFTIRNVFRDVTAHVIAHMVELDIDSQGAKARNPEFGLLPPNLKIK